MSLTARLVNRFRNDVYWPGGLEAFLRNDGRETDSGAFVTTESAMRHSTVYSCVNVLSEDIAKLPLITYKRDGRKKERAQDYWLYALLHDEPNQWQTSVEFRQMMQAHVELSGAAYALKTVVRGETRELLPVVPSRVEVKQLPDYSLSYVLTLPNGEKLPVPADRMFHLRGPSLDGINGVSRITYQRELIGLGIQLRKHGARVFKNGAMIGGVLEHPKVLSDPAAKHLKESFDEQYAGAGNAHKTLLLEEGMKFSIAGMSGKDAQFIESMKFTRSEIAGIFRVPPHKIGDLERATFTNIEHQSIEYVTDSLLPRTVRWEQKISKSLIPAADRKSYFAEHLVDGLLRGDYATRTRGYQVAVTTGWMNRNEVRELENMNPAEGLDEFLEPMNMQNPGDNADPPPNPDNPQPKPKPEDPSYE
jgi:HK97 family phage portal protein